MRIDINTYSGDDFHLLLDFKTKDGESLPLEGYIIHWEIFEQFKKTPRYSFTGADLAVNGGLLSSNALDREKTKEMGSATHAHHIRLDDGNRTTVISGNVNISDVFKQRGSGVSSDTVTIDPVTNQVTVSNEMISAAIATQKAAEAEGFRDEAALFKITDAAFVNDDIVFTRSDGQTFAIVGGKAAITPEDAAEITGAAFVGDDMVFTKADGSTFTSVNAKVELTGPQGEQCPQGDKGDTGEGIGDHRTLGIDDHDDVNMAAAADGDLIQRESGVFVPKAPTLILQDKGAFDKSLPGASVDTANIYAWDSFIRADANTLGISDSGHEWIQQQANPIGIVNNQAHSRVVGTETRVATIATGIGSIAVSGNIAPGYANDLRAGFVIGKDIDNYFRFWVNLVANSIFLDVIISGSSTNLYAGDFVNSAPLRNAFEYSYFDLFLGYSHKARDGESGILLHSDLLNVHQLVLVTEYNTTFDTAADIAFAGLVIGRLGTSTVELSGRVKNIQIIKI